MLPIPRPSKPGGRKSTFPDPPERKRRRVSDSPQTQFNGDRFSDTPGMPQERHLPPPALDLPYSPSGPDQDANKLLGYAPRVPVPWPGYYGYTYYSPHPFTAHGVVPRIEEPSESFPQSGSPTCSTAIINNYGQNPTPPRSDPFRTPQSVLPPRPRQYQIFEQPTPPRSDPLRTAEDASLISSRRHEPSQETIPPLSNTPRAPPQPSVPFRRQFRVPHKDLAVQLVDFEELAAHTAKCDVCDKRNTDGMVRCKPCGWQICHRCLRQRGGDRTHPKAGNLHVPEDAPSARRRAVMTQPHYGPIPNPLKRNGGPSATPEEDAAGILLNLKKNKWERGQAEATSGHTHGSGQVDSHSHPSHRTMDGGLEFDSDETEILPDIDTEDETDDDNLPDSLVNVRRNPSRRARPAEMRE